MAYIPVSDAIAVGVLVDDLSVISPTADKAYDAQVDDKVYKLWYNRSLDAINIQPKNYFDDSEKSSKVGIRRSGTGFSYYFENKPVSGIPANFDNIVLEAAKVVRKTKKLFDKGDSFDPESLKLIFEYMRDKSITSDAPLKVKIPGEKTSYCLWTKKVSQGTSSDPRGHVTEDVKYYLNAQDQKNFDACVQECKLGLEVDDEGRVVSVVTDGKPTAAEEIDAVLFDSEGVWNKRLTSIERQILEDKGFKAPAKPAAGSVLLVHLLTLQKIPEVILSKWAALKTKPTRVNFMDDKFEAGPGIDAGGLTKQFYSDLGRALFDGKPSRSLRVDESGCPFAANPDKLNAPLVKNIGQFLTHVYEKELTIGRSLPDKFFALLKAAAAGGIPSAAPAPAAGGKRKRGPGAGAKASEGEGAGGDQRLLEAAALFAGEYQKPILAWLGGDEGSRDSALEMMECAGEDGLGDLGADEQRARAVEYITSIVRPYLCVAEGVLQGCGKPLLDMLQANTAEEASAALQGCALDAADVASRLNVMGKDKVLKQKAQFLKDHIAQQLAAGDAAWVERFLVCVTGQRALKAGTKINLLPSHDTLCHAHTCSNCINIPTTHETPPLEETDQRKRFIRNLEITMAETGYSTG